MSINLNHYYVKFTTIFKWTVGCLSMSCMCLHRYKILIHLEMTGELTKPFVIQLVMLLILKCVSGVKRYVLEINVTFHEKP